MRKVSAISAALVIAALTGSPLARAQNPPLPPLPPAESPEPPSAPAMPAEPASAPGETPAAAPPTVTYAPAPPAPPAAGPAVDAETSAEASSPPVPTKSVWYGDQTLYADLASVGLVMVGAGVSAATNGGSLGAAMGILGGAGYFLGAPIVHMVHGHGLTAAGDIGLRLGLPVAGVFLGAIIGFAAGSGSSNNGDAFGGLDGLLWGVIVGDVVGMAGAVALDSAVLARETKPDPPSSNASSPPVAFTVVPMLRVVRDREQGGTPVMGVMGRF